MSKPMRWYHSVAIKSFLIAFVATHIPLLGLIAAIVIRPELLSGWGIFWTALGFTLAAALLVIGALYRLFRPLREAADALKGFMSRGTQFRADSTGSDEVARLVRVLVQALAHLDRSRAALLYSSSVAVGTAAAEAPGLAQGHPWLALLEADDWQAFDRAGNLEALQRLHDAMERAIAPALLAGELSLPWGRGRLLAVLHGSGADVAERVGRLCGRLYFENGEAGTASAVLEPQGLDDLSRAAALQRLEHKLFTLRNEGLRGRVA